MEVTTISTTTTLSLPTFHKPSYSLSPPSSSTFFYKPVTHTRLTRPANPARKRGLVCNSLFGLGVPELAVIAGVAALVFGPKQLPEIGRTLGKSIKGFQQAAKEFENELKNPDEGGSSDTLVDGKPTSQNSDENENLVSSSKDSS